MQAGREGPATIAPVHIVYRRPQSDALQSARRSTCRSRMRPSVRSRHRPRAHQSALSGPSMPRSAAAHCRRANSCGRKRRKMDARSQPSCSSQAWAWPGRASAIPAEVHIVAARGYLNKRCSRIAALSRAARHTSAALLGERCGPCRSTHRLASRRGPTLGCVPLLHVCGTGPCTAWHWVVHGLRAPLAGVRRCAGVPARPNKQNSNAVHVTPAAPLAEGRSPEEPRSVTNAGLVRAGARCTVQCSRCGPSEPGHAAGARHVHGRMRTLACRCVRAGVRVGMLVRGRDGGRREKGRKGR